METRNSPILAVALTLTLLLHLTAISPLSQWISRKILPEFSDQSIEINLMDSREEQESPSSSNLKKPELRPLSPEEENAPLFPNSINNRQPLPTRLQDKKVLDPTLSNDKVNSQNRSSIKSTSSRSNSNENKKIAAKTSPLFIKPLDDLGLNLEQPPKDPEFPDSVKDTLREGKPEITQKENLQYSMNTYKWTFKRYVENWAVDLQKWWKAPLDYAFGKVPDGGDVWIQVALSKSGKMLGYKILDSKVTAEMELMVIQALVGSLERMPMPDSFPADALIINWRFIYPPVRPELDLRR